jgi:hypothetical protein
MNVTHVAGLFLVNCGIFSVSYASGPYVRTHDEHIVQTRANELNGPGDGGIDGGNEICAIDGYAWHSQAAPGAGGGTLSPGAFFNPAQIASSSIAFFSQVDGSPRNQGIFVASASGVQAIVRGCGNGGGSGIPGNGCGDPSPFGGTFSGFFGGTFFGPAINAAGDVLFVADVHNGSSPRGLFLYDAGAGQIIKIAAVGDPSPIGGTFGAVGPGSINDQGDVVFLASPVGSINSNIFLWHTGVTTKVAAIGDPAPGGGVYSLLGTESLGFADGTSIPVGPLPDINNNGQISFRAIVSGGTTSRGVIVSTGGAHLWYVKVGEPTPAGGTYFDFQAASINNQGQIAFFADFQPAPSEFSSGWFAGAPGNWRKVLAFFDPLEGGQCWGLAFSRNPMQTIGEQGEVILWTDVQLTGGQNTQERILVNHPDGSMTTLVRKGDFTPLGGTFGTLQAWPSMSGGGGTYKAAIGAGTPGAGGGGIFSAQFVAWSSPTGDVNGDCLVNVADLLAVIASWGPCGGCSADVNNDGVVNVTDLLLVIQNWSA